MFKAERTTTIVIVLLMCGLTGLGLASGYPRQAILFPIVASACAIFFAIMRHLEIGKAEVVGYDDAELREVMRTDAGALELREAMRPFAWVVGVLIFLYLFGYQIGLTAYVFTFLISHSIGWRTALGISVGTAIGIFLIFTQVLNSLLPVGLVGDALGF